MASHPAQQHLDALRGHVAQGSVQAAKLYERILRQMVDVAFDKGGLLRRTETEWQAARHQRVYRAAGAAVRAWYTDAWLQGRPGMTA